MKSGRILLVSFALLCATSAFADEVPPEACTGRNCMQKNAKPAQECEGEDCAQLPAQGMTECSGRNCDAIPAQPDSGPQIETVEPEPSK